MDCRLCSWLNLSRPDGWVRPDSYRQGQIRCYPCCALLFLIPPSIFAQSRSATNPCRLRVVQLSLATFQDAQGYFPLVRFNTSRPKFLLWVFGDRGT